MKILKLTQGKHALVDDDDYPIVSEYNWYALRVQKDGERWYAATGSTIYLHRFIMKVSDSRIVDHVDGDGLNCQKYNLRIFADNTKNLQNNARNRAAENLKRALPELADEIFTTISSIARQSGLSRNAVYRFLFAAKITGRIPINHGNIIITHLRKYRNRLRKHSNLNPDCTRSRRKCKSPPVPPRRRAGRTAKREMR